MSHPSSFYLLRRQSMLANLSSFALMISLQNPGTPDPVELLDFDPGQTIPITDCSVTEPVSDRVIRLLVPTSILPFEGRQVSVNNGVDRDDFDFDEVYAFREVKPFEAGDLNTRNNPFHFDLVEISKGDSALKKWYKVKIVIENPKYTFVTNDQVTGITRSPWRGTNPDPFENNICLAQVGQPDVAPTAVKKHPKTNVSTLTFYVRKGRFKALPLSLNIAIRLADPVAFGSDTPIIIDPKIKNDGNQ